MDIQSWFTANWQPLAIGAVAGLILGWLFFYLPASARARRYSEQASSLDSQLSDANRALHETRRQYDNVQTELTAQNVRYNAMEGHVAALQADQDLLTQSQQELMTLRQQVSSLSSNNSDLETKLHQVRGEVAGELAILSSTMLRLKDEALAEAQGQVAALKAELEAFKAG